MATRYTHAMHPHGTCVRVYGCTPQLMRLRLGAERKTSSARCRARLEVQACAYVAQIDLKDQRRAREIESNVPMVSPRAASVLLDKIRTRVANDVENAITD